MTVLNVLEVSHLSYAYKKGTPVLKDVSFAVKTGEALGIIGLSGCGKTTLCYCLCGLIPHIMGGSMQGDLLLAGRSTKEMPLPFIAQQAGMVFQEPDSQMVASTVEDELAFGPENLCRPPEEIKKTVNGLLEFFGLEKQRLMNPLRLSGGQKQLVAIAAVLALHPRILVLDEPLSHLDKAGRLLVENILRRLVEEQITVIMVEHDLQRVLWADRWLVMEEGKILGLDRPQVILNDKDFLQQHNFLAGG